MKKNIKTTTIFIFVSLLIIYKLIDHLKENVEIVVIKEDKLIDSGTNSVTVVAMYFKLNHSKHSLQKYDNWISNFLKSVSSPIVMYTDKESKDKLLNIRNPLPIELIVVNDIWDVLKQVEIERKRSYADKYRNEQYNIDREKHIHNPNLYAIWNLKSFMTKHVSIYNPFKSSFFVYADAGAWREKVIPYWPNTNFTMRLKQLLDDKILFGQIDPSEANPDSIYANIIEGGFFAGSKKAINDFSNLFWNLHDELLDNGSFVGKDQRMMNILAFQRNRNQIIRLRTWGLACKVSYDPWFFFIYFLANDELYICQEKRELLLINLDQNKVF